MLGKILESSLDSKEIKPVNPKRNQPWIFIRKIDAEAETPVLWPPDVKNWLTEKDPDAGKDRRQEKKGMTEDEMIQWRAAVHGVEKSWTRLSDWTDWLSHPYMTKGKTITLTRRTFVGKVMTNLDNILKTRDIILLAKICLVKAMVFLVVMYWCESWTIKKTERQIIDTFELWC